MIWNCGSHLVVIHFHQLNSPIITSQTEVMTHKIYQSCWVRTLIQLANFLYSHWQVEIFFMVGVTSYGANPKAEN